MSDFLGNLASKSLSLASVIQPGPVSLFEPWRTGGALAAAQRSFDTPPDTAPAFEPVEVDRSTLKAERGATVPAHFDPPHREVRDHTDEALRSAAPHPSLSLESILFQPPPTPRRVLAPIVSQPLWREHDASNGTSAPAPIDRTVTVQNETLRAPAHATPSIGRLEQVIVEDGSTIHDRVERLPAERVIVERERADQGHVAQPGALHVIAALPAPGAADAKSTARPPVTPIIERVERVKEISDQGQVDRLSILRTPRSLTAASRLMPTAQSSAPPAVHVTIGRIEVRATPPSTPVKRASSSQPTVSLEEYLRSRSGDRR